MNKIQQIAMPLAKAGTQPQANQAKVKTYETPVLISYGDVRDITLGPTLGGGESGCINQSPFGGLDCFGN